MGASEPERLLSLKISPPPYITCDPSYILTQTNLPLNILQFIYFVLFRMVIYKFLEMNAEASKHIVPSIHFHLSLLILCRVVGGLDPIPADIGQEAG